MGITVENETSKCSMGETTSGGVVSIVTPLEEEVMCRPDAVIASTVM